VTGSDDRRVGSRAWTPARSAHSSGEPLHHSGAALDRPRPDLVTAAPGFSPGTARPGSTGGRDLPGKYWPIGTFTGAVSADSVSLAETW